MRARASSDRLPDPARRGRPDEGAPRLPDEELRRLASARFEAVSEASGHFFHEHAARVSEACRDMAERFRRGGRLLAIGDDAQPGTDALHVSVEFVHPVLVGKRALPALAMEGGEEGLRRLRLLTREQDIVLFLSSRAPGAAHKDALRALRERGALTVSLEGGAEASGGGADSSAARAGAAEPASKPIGEADHAFRVDHPDPTIVQEVQETLYHVLWELVHVFFEGES